MWKTCKISKKEKFFSQTCTFVIKKHENHMKNDSIEKLRLLKKSFFFSFSTMRLKNIIKFNYSTSLSSNDITKMKIMKIIKKFNLFKTSRFFDISNRIIQLLISLLLFELHIFYNVCYAKNYCSKIFKNSITMMLKKFENDDLENSRDYSKLKSYKLITLLKILNKMYEIIMTTKIAWMIEIYNFLSRNHMKSRKCTFTEHAMHSLMKKITIVWNKNKIVSTLFLNVNETFDNVSHFKLLHNLKKKRIDIRIVEWINNFLQNRSTSIKTNEINIENIDIDTNIFVKHWR